MAFTSLIKLLIENSKHFVRLHSVRLGRNNRSVRREDCNALLVTFASQLTRFERETYSIPILEEARFFSQLDSARVEHLDVQAFESDSILAVLAKPCPNLRFLSISHTMSMSFARYIASEGYGTLLDAIAKNTGNLRRFVYENKCFDFNGTTTLRHMQEIALANPRLRCLNFDTVVGPNSFTPPYFAYALPLESFNQLWSGSLAVPEKWHTLPLIVREQFGIDISRLRISRRSVFELAMVGAVRARGLFLPPLAASNALLRACYPSEQYSSALRVDGLSIFCIEAILPDAAEFRNVATEEGQAFLQWWQDEINFSSSDCDDNPSEWDGVVRAALALWRVSCTKDGNSALSDNYLASFKSILIKSNPQSPILSLFNALSPFHRSDIEAILPTILKAILNPSDDDARFRKLDLTAKTRNGRSVGVILGCLNHLCFVAALSNPAEFDLTSTTPGKKYPNCVRLFFQCSRHEASLFSSALVPLLDLCSTPEKLQALKARRKILPVLQALAGRDADQLFLFDLCIRFLTEDDLLHASVLLALTESPIVMQRFYEHVRGSTKCEPEEFHRKLLPCIGILKKEMVSHRVRSFVAALESGANGKEK